MKSKHCENCGDRIYNLGCSNCSEVRYIEQQYHELEMDVPELIYKEARKKEALDNKKSQQL